MELVKSIQSTLYERVVSPLAGVFLISWAVMHYDLVMMLMSKNDMIYKTQVIYEYMIVDAKYNWGDWVFISAAPYWYGLIKPLLYSFFALSFYSLLAPFAFRISSWSKYRLQIIRRDYDKKTPVSAEKFDKIQELYNQKKDQYRESQQKFEVEIESYKKIGEEFKVESIRLSAELSELKDDMKRQQYAANEEKTGLSVALEAANKNYTDSQIKVGLYEEENARLKSEIKSYELTGESNFNRNTQEDTVVNESQAEDARVRYELSAVDEDAINNQSSVPEPEVKPERTISFEPNRLSKIIGSQFTAGVGNSIGFNLNNSHLSLPISEHLNNPFLNAGIIPVAEHLNNPFLNAGINPVAEHLNNPFLNAGIIPVAEHLNNPFLNAGINPVAEHLNNPFLNAGINPVAEHLNNPLFNQLTGPFNKL